MHPGAHRPLRVTFFIDKLGQGGAQTQLLLIAKGLDRKRFDVSIATFYPGGVMEDAFHQVPNVRFACFKRRHKLDFTPVLQAARFLRRNRTDVVMAFLPVASVMGMAAATIARVPVRIATKRTGGPKRASFGDGMFRALEHRFARRADAAVANSDAGREYLVEQGVRPERALTVWNGVDLDGLDAKAGAADEAPVFEKGEGERVVGMAASMTPQKDQATLLRAAAIVKREVPNVRYVLLGDGPLRESLEELSRDLGIADDVAFMGFRSDVAAFYRTFDLGVLATIHPEGHSNFLLEAMALGCPVIASDTGGTDEFVIDGETGRLVPPQEPEALAAAIVDLLKDEAKAKRLASAGQRFVREGFSVERMVETYATMFEDLAAGRPARAANPSLAAR